MQKKEIRYLVMAALFVALDIVFTRFLSFYPPTVPTFIVRISPQFLAHALCGWILGPWWAIGSAVAADLIGFFMFPSPFPFFIGYTISAAMGGLVYGLLLHKKKVVLWRSVLAVAIAIYCFSIPLTALWNVILYQRGWVLIFANQLLWRTVFVPVYAIVLYMVQKALVRSKVLDRQ